MPTLPHLHLCEEKFALLYIISSPFIWLSASCGSLFNPRGHREVYWVLWGFIHCYLISCFYILFSLPSLTHHANFHAAHHEHIFLHSPWASDNIDNDVYFVPSHHVCSWPFILSFTLESYSGFCLLVLGSMNLFAFTSQVLLLSGNADMVLSYPVSLNAIVAMSFPV